MARIYARPGLRDGLFALGLLGLLAGLLGFPRESVEAARGGVELCLNVILPSLFPFFCVSTLAVRLGLLEGPGRVLGRVMGPLFRVGGVCAGAFLLGIVGGYPVGARTAIELYESGAITKTEAERLLGFCNNAGPAFSLGVVGAGVFGGSRWGLLLYGAHVASSVLIGLLLRFYRPGEGPGTGRIRRRAEVPSFPEAFTGSVTAAFSSTLHICGFVIFFTVLIRLLFLTGILSLAARALTAALGGLGMQEPWAESLLTGTIELTSGVWSLRDLAGMLDEKLCLAAFMLGWAGLSVHCQVLSFVGRSGLSTRTYFFGKLLHGLFSAGLILALGRLFGTGDAVEMALASQVGGLATLRFHRALGFSCLASAGTLMLLGWRRGTISGKKAGNYSGKRV